MKDLKAGNIFEHYKGKRYRVHGLVRHSETLEEMVYYECLYENEMGQMWVRPVELFLSSVEIDGHKQPRFRYVEEKGQ